MDEEREIRDSSEIAEEEYEGGSRRRALTPRQRFWTAFVMGGITCLLALTVVTGLIGLGGFITPGRLEYYHELDDAYGKYYEIVKMIGEDPIAEETPAEITEDALKELVAGTGDPYAQYFTSEEYKEFEKRYSRDYVGIGITVADVDGAITVMSVFEEGPAEEAGMMAGDVIVSVDGVKPSDLDDAVSRMTGEAGTSVTVTVEREGRKMDFDMIRSKLEQKSVGYSVLEEDSSVGYIRIASFRNGTDDEFKAAVKDLEKKGCDSFILDLRDNGGGLTDVSVAIADYLLPACRIMTDVKKDGTETVYNSKASSADIDLVVLVNENTASASEILTGAIKDNHAGAIIGSRTYGKGVTQITHRFSDGSAVKLTESEYYTPNGDKVQGEGIEPDIEAEGDELLEAALKELGK